MTSWTRTIIIACGLAAVAPLSPACSQLPARAQITAEGLAARARAGLLHDAEAAVAADILGQNLEGYSASDRTLLLIALLEVAKSNGASASDAGATIALAGSKRAAVPLNEAFDALRDIYSNGATVGQKGAALFAMRWLVDRPGVLQFWRSVATADSTGFTTAQERAVDLLAGLDDPLAREILRQMYVSNAVRNSGARAVLSVLAARGFTWKPRRDR